MVIVRTNRKLQINLKMVKQERISFGCTNLAHELCSKRLLIGDRGARRGAGLGQPARAIFRGSGQRAPSQPERLDPEKEESFS